MTKEEIAKTFYEIEAKRNETVKLLDSISTKKEEAENKKVEVTKINDELVKIENNEELLANKLKGLISF